MPSAHPLRGQPSICNFCDKSISEKLQKMNETNGARVEMSINVVSKLDRGINKYDLSYLGESENHIIILFFVIII